MSVCCHRVRAGEPPLRVLWTEAKVGQLFSGWRYLRRLLCGCIDRMRPRCAFVLAAATWAGAAGCSTPDDRSAAPSPTTTAPVTSASTSPATFLCGMDTRVPNPAAPPYVGHGPHLVAGGAKSTGVSDLIGSFSVYSLPLEWRADASRAQLVVCLGGVRKRDTMPIGTCEWDIAEGDVYPATYTFEVYEAKTGRSLATFPIASSGSADASCPPTVNVRPGEGRVAVAQSFTEQTLASMLKPFVMQDAG